jgi:hypothetical protein
VHKKLKPGDYYLVFHRVSDSVQFRFRLIPRSAIAKPR